MLVHWTKLIFCHCQVALCKLFTFIIISVHKGQFMKFHIEDIRRGGAKIWIPFSSGENIILRMSAWCTSKVPVFVPMPQRWKWGARVVQWWEHKFASHRCGLGSNPGIDSICRLSLLLVLSFFRTGVSPGTPLFTSP